MPLDAKTYMHRVGRTARAGRLGCALTLLTQYSVVFFLKEIESHLISSESGSQERIPCLVEPNSTVDNALEKAIEELDAQVKEASVQSSLVRLNFACVRKQICKYFHMHSNWKKKLKM